MGIAAIILAASNLLSRLMGLVRDKVISWQFGAGEEADLYFAAFVVPDCINYLLAGGFLSITLIPLLSRAEKEDEGVARDFFSCVTSWMAISSILLTVLCMILADPLAHLIAPGFPEARCARLAFFMRIILPAQIFFLTGSCATALLMLRRQFRVPALTPLIYNGSIILSGLALPLFVSLAEGQSYQEASAQVGMVGYCAGVTIGAFLGAFLLPVLTAKIRAF
ncbi:MAG: murein biosynthesis integral membrane protein MurJ, partial [Desulfovibrionaceae bacterium]|nr:murein biosynthesis integral membrane protein MurJ [Desulfovibrionaceae bacterium]